MQEVSFGKVTELIKTGSVWAMPTDTIYGLSCLFSDKLAISRIDAIKRRDLHKSYIVLIGDIEQLNLLGVAIEEKHKNFLATVWPGPVSVVLPTDSGSEQGIAVRVPQHADIRALCAHIGPVISTSINHSGEPPLIEIDTIRDSFASEIDFIVTDNALPTDHASTLVKILR